MPSDRAPIVAAAIATARTFVVKAPAPATGVRVHLHMSLGVRLQV
jgi:hypothetical protein